MIGNLISNKILLDLIDSQIIEFKPFFDVNLMQLAQYPLTVSSFIEKSRNSYKVVHNFAKSDSFNIKPNQYLIAEIHEQVILPPGIAGRFLSSSNLIELGIGLEKGKIEYPFGRNGERIRFGVKNLLDEEIIFSKDMIIAYIELYDLRGLGQLDVRLTERDLQVYSRRYPFDHDGEVKYEL